MALRLDHLPTASLAARLAERLAADGWTASTAPDGVCPVIPLAGPHVGLVSRHARLVAPRQRPPAAARRSSSSSRCASSGSRPSGRAASALDALVGFHERRFEERGGSTAFCTPAVRAFQDEATRRALDRGWLRMYVLRLNGEIAAVMYGFIYDGRFYFYQHGFDDRYQRAQHRPGADGADDSRGHRRRRADSTCCGAPSRTSRSGRARRGRCSRIQLFPPHVGGRVHRRAVEARRRLGRLARRVLSPGEPSCT